MFLEEIKVIVEDSAYESVGVYYTRKAKPCRIMLLDGITSE